MACFCAVWLSWRRAAFTNKFVLRILTPVCQMFSFCCEGLSFTGSFMGINLDFRILQALKTVRASSTNRTEMSHERGLCKHAQIVRSRGRSRPAHRSLALEWGTCPCQHLFCWGTRAGASQPRTRANPLSPRLHHSCPEGLQDQAPDEMLAGAIVSGGGTKRIPLNHFHHTTGE